MIIVADAGSTKTSWAIVNNEGEIVERIHSPGYNPLVGNPISFYPELANSLGITDSLYYYGSGINDLTRAQVESELSHFTKLNCNLNISDDLTAAGIALFGERSGIASILGTGSNFGMFDGQNITSRKQSMGYLINDDGGGSSMGRRLLRDYYNKNLPNEIQTLLDKIFDMDRIIVLGHLYNDQRPNAFIAKFSEVLSESDHPYCQELVALEFREFLKSVSSYYAQSKLIGFVGGIAMTYQNTLRHLCKSEGYRIENIIHSPIDHLARYHFNKNHP